MYKKIKEITEGVYPFHMPGHKRNADFLDTCPDITEICGADDLNHPNGIIKTAEEKAAELFGVKKTYFSTCGSTACILAAITAVTKSGNTLLVSRNCHKSVYNSAFINSLKTEYILPQRNFKLDCFGAVSAKGVEDALKKTSARAVVITSPTYEGFVSDIPSIADVVHKNGGLLIVDAAHGAHLGFSDRFPPSARHEGADIVIESAHKTLPSLTQAALLHICSENVDSTAVKAALSVFNTSSPSYPIIASIDLAVNALEKDRQRLFCEMSDRIDRLKEACKNLEKLYIYSDDNLDKTKILIGCDRADINGFELKKLLLEEYNIECEMAMPNYLLCMASVADTEEGFLRLEKALFDIDKKIGKSHSLKYAVPAPVPRPVTTIRSALESKTLTLPLLDAVGKISADYIYAYPPSSPLIAPGELITNEAVKSVLQLIEQGASVYRQGGEPDKINIIKTE